MATKGFWKIWLFYNFRYMINYISSSFKHGSKVRRTVKKFLFARTGIFLSIAKAMAYHHASACISSTTACRCCISSHRRCVYLSAWWYTTSCKVDDMQFLRNWWYTMLRIDSVALRAKELTFCVSCCRMNLRWLLWRRKNFIATGLLILHRIFLKKISIYMLFLQVIIYGIFSLGVC